jgi:hypothetical protein
MPTIGGWSLDFILVVAILVGPPTAFFFALLFTDMGYGGQGQLSDLLSRVQTIRGQIELYNVQNPQTPYDETTPVGPTFWDPLVRGDYLPGPQMNEFQDNSSLVVSAPREGAGWVWAEAVPGEPWTLNRYAVDEDGDLLDWDEDGRPD